MDRQLNTDCTVKMPFQRNDGGRADAGFRGLCEDCVTRSVAIVAGLPYSDVYKAVSRGMASQRRAKSRTARNGVITSRKWFKDYMKSLGFRWVPTMRIGQGCKVHLVSGELPLGRLVVALSRHFTAVIDGVIHDTSDPQRTTYYYNDNNLIGQGERCVYGYYILENVTA